MIVYTSSGIYDIVITNIICDSNALRFNSKYSIQV